MESGKTALEHIHIYLISEAKNRLAGKDGAPQRIAGVHQRWQFRTRADEMHVAREDVPKLRQFIDFVFAEESAGARHSRISRRRDHRALAGTVHGAQFDQAKNLAVLTDAILAKEDGESARAR